MTRSTSPLRSRTRVEKSIPSVNGGFGNASQEALARTPRAVIASSNRLRIADSGNRQEKVFMTTCGKTCLFTFRNYFVTLIFPPTPRAFTLRSYIDSAKTGGTTNSPRLPDLI